MVRTQIQLTEHQSEELHRLASKQGVSIAELIRRSIDDTLSKPQITEEMREKARSSVGFINSVMTDEVFEPAVRMVVTNGYASTSTIQRQFKIGYTRAARLVDAMEQQGMVGPADGAKPREVLVMKEDLESLFGGQVAELSVVVVD